ncbi:MAG: type II/IV secretion system ATPase subunit [Euryarchaeota archaeon]|nr:type II/IV secretion system ATPase subunit [Euryarchaeota archaeon]
MTETTDGKKKETPPPPKPTVPTLRPPPGLRPPPAKPGAAPPKPATPAPVTKPAAPSAPAAPASGPQTSLIARARADAPQQGPARQYSSGDDTKASMHLTKELSAAEREKTLRTAVSESVARPGVIKVPEWETNKMTMAPQIAPTPPPPAPGQAPAPGAAPAPLAGPAAPAPPGASPVAAAKTEQVAIKAPAPGAAPAGAAPKGAPAAGTAQATAGGAAAMSAIEADPDDPFPLTEHDKQIDFYPILEPYCYIQIVYNDYEKDTKYRVIEPVLTKEERKVLRFVEDTMVDVLDAPPEELEGKSMEDFLKGKFEEVLYDYSIVLGDEQTTEEQIKNKLLYYIFRDFIGEGRIDPLIRDALIEDISCDGPHQPVFIYHRKYESIKSNVKFRNDDQLDSFVIRMAQRAGKHISIAEPILDATMRDGSRIQATLSTEVSAKGSTFTIRKFRSEPFTPPDLVKFGTMSAEILAYWWIAIQHAASAIYAGGPASGKTTSLNAILLFIPPQMKIVSIEDTRELAIPHPNWIPGITRSGFGPRDKEGRQMGEIDMFQLLKNALRQRPEYIIVGEVRGKEAYNLFQAMATGHAAYGTMHADSVDAVIHRLESDPINIPRPLLEALDIVSIQIQTRVGDKRVRRTKQIAEIVGLDPHTREILTNEVFRWQPKDDSFKFSGVSYVMERIQAEKGMTAEQMKKEMTNRVEIIEYMIRHKVRDYREVARIVNGYYKDPNGTLEKVRKDEPWH